MPNWATLFGGNNQLRPKSLIVRFLHGNPHLKSSRKDNALIIVFSGTDGAGKSTQISLLTEFLESKGIRTKYLWARGGYTPLLTAIKGAAKRLLNKNSVLEDSNYAAKRKGMISRPFVARVWLIAAMLDMVLLYAIYLRLLNWIGRTVICDRYVADTRIDFCRNFPMQFSTRMWLWRLLVAVSPRPDLHFLLYVPVDVSLARSLAKNEPFPDSPETLEYRLHEYLNTADFDHPDILKIDCQSPIEEIQAKIRAGVVGTKPL